jgi:hypothetical protein
MTNTPKEPEEQGPPNRVRIILPREVCTTPEQTAALLYEAIMGRGGEAEGRVAEAPWWA